MNRPPLTPRFLIVSATAMAALTPELAARRLRRDGRMRWDPRVSLAFLQVAGFWSHCRIAARTSSWPYVSVTTLDEMVEDAAYTGTLSEQAEIGAIALAAYPAEDSSGERWAQCGVVTDVRGRSTFPHWRRYDTEVTWGVLDDDGGIRAISTAHSFEVRRGDRFIHWWNRADGVALPNAA